MATLIHALINLEPENMKNSMKIAAFLLITLLLGACDSQGQKDITEAPLPPAEKASTVYQVGDQLPNETVCMVNNAYMEKRQIPVPVNGRTYYGCCQMCVGKLQEQESARTATDPFSGNKIDKSEAYIVLTDPEGAVAYFESEQNYRKFSEETK